MVTAEIGKLSGQVEQDLRKQFGTKDGQLLAPVAAIVSATEKAVKEQITAFQSVYKENVDPDRRESTIGRMVSKVDAMLDPKRKDSLQAKIEQAVQSVSSEDGALVATVKKMLTTAIKPLRDEIDRLRKDFQRQDAAAEALAKTTSKGSVFEGHILEICQCLGRLNGIIIEHVGIDHQARRRSPLTPRSPGRGTSAHCHRGAERCVRLRPQTHR